MSSWGSLSHSEMTAPRTAGLFEPPPVMFKIAEEWFRTLFLNHLLADAEFTVKSGRQRMENAKAYEQVYLAKARLFDWDSLGSDRPFKFQNPEIRVELVPNRVDSYIVSFNGREMERPKAVNEAKKLFDEEIKAYHILMTGRYVKKMTSGPQFTEAQEKKKLVEAIGDVQLLKRLGATKGKEVKSWKKGKLKVDLTGWKYLDSLTPEQKKLAEARTIVLKFMWASSSKDWGGYWMDKSFELAIAAHDPISLSETAIQKSLDRMRSTLGHELMHAGQTIIQVAKGLSEEAGLPGDQYRTEGIDPSGRYQVPGGPKKQLLKHKDQDVEFYTNLYSDIEKFKQEYRGVPADEALKDAETMARQISKRYNHPRKGAKAYGEFMKAIREWVSVKVAMQKTSDMNPPLGRPGGPCHVVKRIEDTVANPKVQDRLTDKVEDGESLSNPEAATVYDLGAERVKGLVNKLYIGPHAKYRMDLRSVTVKDLKDAIMEMGKDFHEARKSGDPRRFQKYKDFGMNGQKLEYISRKNLKVVLAPKQDGAMLVTTFWKGRPDPAPPGSCEVRVAERYMKEAGLIEPPPKLLEDVRKAALGIVCSHTWAQAEVKVQETARIVQGLQTGNAGVSGWTKEEAEQAFREVLVEHQRVVNFCKKYTNKPRAYKTKGTAKFKVNLSGWKYLRSGMQISLVTQFFNPLAVEVHFRNRKTLNGTWKSSKATITVDGFPYTFETYEAFMQRLERLDRTLVHECRHVAQTFLHMLTEGQGGLLSPDLRDQKPDYKKEWALKDIEFQPLVGDAIREAKKYLTALRQKGASPEKLRAALDNYLGAGPKVPGFVNLENPRLAILRDKAPERWREALAEVGAAVQDYL
jgi:hypothetical protein